MDIQHEIDDGICTIAFNRPDKKNAITAAMYQALVEVLTAADTDSAVRVVLIKGHEQIFTAGNDLEDFLRNPPKDDHSPVVLFMQALAGMHKPVIAAVAGSAIGIGTTMLLHCDLVYAAEDARFAMPFTQLGLCPEFASSLLLQRLCGYHRAAEKLLLGDMFVADEARTMGLVNQVLPVAELLPFALRQAARIVALPPSSVRATKRLMKGSQVSEVAAQMRNEMDVFRDMLEAPEAKEAFTAFFEKRKADFSRF